MRPVRAFLLGCGAIGVAVYGLALAVAVLAQAGGWPELRIAAGPLVLLAVEHTSASVATTLGPGLLLVALTGGILNAFGAYLIERRSRKVPVAVD